MPEQSFPPDPEPAVRRFYLHALELLDESGVPYVVGGGYAMAYYTGIVRHTKDLDVFIRREDRERVLEVFAAQSYRTEITWPHFLCKAVTEGAFVDMIYNSANGLSPVDDAFFEFAVNAEVLGRPAKLCPVEEMIWSKAFVQDRDRYDGADIAHLLRARAEKLDWARLCERFRGHERVLLAHLLLFGYVYPAERERVPAGVMDQLMRQIRTEPPASEPRCRGTFLSHDQYFFDVKNWGYRDARLKPTGPLAQDEIATISPT